MVLFNACAEVYGKEKDCRKLAALSKFLEDIKGTKGGKAFLKNYEGVESGLLQKINSSESKQKIYAYIWDVLSCCTQLISLNEYERCLNELKFMLKNLKKEL